jgi:hypothetical protein
MISVFFSSKCRLFHNATLFGSCIIHILNTGCAKIKKRSGAKGLSEFTVQLARNIGLICFFSLLTGRQYLPPHSTSIPVRVTVLNPINKFLAFYVNRKLIPVFTIAYQLPLC